MPKNVWNKVEGREREEMLCLSVKRGRLWSIRCRPL